jgi:signal transduction histidine kinase
MALLILFSNNGIASVLASYEDTFKNSDSAYRIVDASGDFVTGLAKPTGRPFATASLADCFPGWKVELYFKGGEVFDKAADRQIAIYIWTGALVILLILVIAAFAARAIGRQIRLNKMKNDFIATVSHELKTPLASMRVLVDTLLEGNIKDETQTEEYLRLTAKENERLSRMIDNFLTFSRMERNKKAFEIIPANPVAIANDAVEVVRTKYATHKCQFTTDITSKLPEIAADHDAMVTVVVNLLDNACKYTGEHKQVSLKVFAEKGCVCFAVSDNGIGIARRHIRKIFDSFYQVDNSLARKAEGCGLGLSIVKFIVDAHKGKISVDSKPGKGSTFTVRLPIGRNSKNGNSAYN